MKTVGERSGESRPGQGANVGRHPAAWLPVEAGLGVPCSEAQADGVPCPELMPDCSDCAEKKARSFAATERRNLGQSDLRPRGHPAPGEA